MSKKRPRSLGYARYDLETAAKEFNFSEEDLLTFAADDKISMYVLLPDRFNTWNVHQSYFDLEIRRIAATPLGIDPRERKDVRALKISREKCGALRNSSFVMQDFFSAGLVEQDISGDAVYPEDERMEHVRAPSDKQVWAYSAYLKLLPESEIKKSDPRRPEDLKITIKDIVLLRQDLVTLAWREGSKSIRAVFGDYIEIPPDYVSRKLMALIAAYEKFWLSMAMGQVHGLTLSELQVIDAKVEGCLFQFGVFSTKTSREAVARAAAEMIRPPFVREILCAPQQRAAVRESTQLLQRRTRRLKKVLSITDLNHPPELLVLFAVMRFWERADIGASSEVRNRTIKSLKLWGFSRRQQNAGAVILRPEAAPNGRPKK